jgi:DNA-directed RNA polymerase specialized sigma24 family protein
MLVGKQGGGMAGVPDGAELERLLAERGRQLMRVAIALAGDRESGEDLLQAALERVLSKPRRVDSDTRGLPAAGPLQPGR